MSKNKDKKKDKKNKVSKLPNDSKNLIKREDVHYKNQKRHQNHSSSSLTSVKKENQSSSKITCQKPPSLRNIGATCYLNSAFQGISACNTFSKLISDLSDTYKDVQQLHVFKGLMEILRNFSGSCMEISRNQIFRDWNKPGQQDSYDLLAYALNQVYNELRKFMEMSTILKPRDLRAWLRVDLPMRFIIRYEIRCGCGEVTYSPLQSDLALHVTIPRLKGGAHLDDLVDVYFGEDYIEDYGCDTKYCDGKNTKRIAKLQRPLPKTICIHLQRTFWSGDKMVKINDDVKFGTELILKNCYWSPEDLPCEDKACGASVPLTTVSSDASKKFETKNKGSKADSAKRKENPEAGESYDLVSVVVHGGTTNGGHYTCYKRVGKQWFHTNDSMIREVTERQVLDCQAYILFYEQPYTNLDDPE